MDSDKRVREAIARLLDDARRVENAKAEQRPLVYILGSNNNVQIGNTAPWPRRDRAEASREDSGA
jgi:hypothetical protein